MRFKDYLTEILAKEQGRGYFVLPTDINNMARIATNIESRKLRDNYSKEVLDCLFVVLKKFLKNNVNKSFVVQKFRDENINALQKLDIDINNAERELAKILLRNF